MTDTDIATLALLRDRILEAASRPGAEDDAESPAWRLLTDVHADLADIVKRHAAPESTDRSVTVSLAGVTWTAEQLAAEGLEVVVTGYDADDRPMYGVGRASP